MATQHNKSGILIDNQNAAFLSFDECPYINIGKVIS